MIKSRPRAASALLFCAPLRAVRRGGDRVYIQKIVFILLLFDFDCLPPLSPFDFDSLPFIFEIAFYLIFAQ